MHADAIVIGGGIVGLATARVLARRGATVLVATPEEPGGASSAAAGILAPTVSPPAGEAFEFACRAREYYRAFAEELFDETGIDVELSLNGVLRVAMDEAAAEELQQQVTPDVRWLAPREVAELEPALGATFGGLLHAADGYVANEKVHAALRSCVRRHSRIVAESERVVRVTESPDTGCVLANGARWSADAVVVAAGAWSPGIAGVMRPLAVRPVRGQMIAVHAAGLQRAVFGAGGYVVPRRDLRVLVGSTMEDVGFDPSVTEEGGEELLNIAGTLLPDSSRAILAHWSGLRPMSQRDTPFLERDPNQPSVIYAVGHSKNGILTGPLSGVVAAQLVLGEGSTP